MIYAIADIENDERVHVLIPSCLIRLVTFNALNDKFYIVRMVYAQGLARVFQCNIFLCSQRGYVDL